MFDVIVNNSKGERIKNFHCPVSECSIGKARDNFVQLRGWKIAPHHAVISRSAEGLFIEDKTGQSRIEVNGEDVEHHGPIRSSDEIIIGGYYIQAGITESSQQKEDIDEDDDNAFDDMKTVIGVMPHDVLEESEELSKTLVSLQHIDKFKWRNRVHDELLDADLATAGLVPQVVPVELVTKRFGSKIFE